MRFSLIAAIFTFLFMTAGHMAVATAKDADFEAARKQCEASVAKDANGRPTRGKMRTCLEAKGFKPPHRLPGSAHDGPPHGDDDHGNPPPPPRDE